MCACSNGFLEDCQSGKLVCFGCEFILDTSSEVGDNEQYQRNQNLGNQTGNKNENKTGNQTGGNEATVTAYAIGGGGANPDSNVVTGTFLLNSCYASMLFNSGVDRSFVSSTFSALLDVAPSTLDTSYAVELANGRISKTNVILRGCMVTDIKEKDKIEAKTGQNEKRGKVNQVKVKPIKTGYGFGKSMKYQNRRHKYLIEPTCTRVNGPGQPNMYIS
nr:putative reverse transcriptase domain-containing protein [Tanacetum cinerariifolium]